MNIHKFYLSPQKQNKVEKIYISLSGFKSLMEILPTEIRPEKGVKSFRIQIFLKSHHHSKIILLSLLIGNYR